MLMLMCVQIASDFSCRANKSLSNPGLVTPSTNRGTVNGIMCGVKLLGSFHAYESVQQQLGCRKSRGSITKRV
jgi:hypothetical protein